jgi:hypothetical protein
VLTGPKKDLDLVDRPPDEALKSAQLLLLEMPMSLGFTQNLSVHGVFTPMEW